jgi:hypothetical protein
METDGIPVLIRYHTRFPDETGVMREYADVYGRAPVYAMDYPPVGSLWPATGWATAHAAVAPDPARMSTAGSGSSGRGATAAAATAATETAAKLSSWQVPDALN